MKPIASSDLFVDTDFPQIYLFAHLKIWLIYTSANTVQQQQKIYFDKKQLK